MTISCYTPLWFNPHTGHESIVLDSNFVDGFTLSLPQPPLHLRKHFEYFMERGNAASASSCSVYYSFADNSLKRCSFMIMMSKWMHCTTLLIDVVLHQLLAKQQSNNWGGHIPRQKSRKRNLAWQVWFSQPTRDCRHREYRESMCIPNLSTSRFIINALCT